MAHKKNKNIVVDEESKKDNLQEDLDKIRKDFADVLSPSTATPQENKNSNRVERDSKRPSLNEAITKACDILERKAKKLGPDEKFDFYNKYMNGLSNLRREGRNSNVRLAVRERLDAVIQVFHDNMNSVIQKRRAEHQAEQSLMKLSDPDNLSELRSKPQELRQALNQAQQYIDKCTKLGSNMSQDFQEKLNGVKSDCKKETAKAAAQSKREHYKEHGKDMDSIEKMHKEPRRTPGMGSAGG